MRIRITQPGWEKFNDMFGSVHFEDGVSTHDVTHREAMSLGSIVSVELLDGTPIGAAQHLLDIKASGLVAPEPENRRVVEPPPPTEPEEIRIYTESELMKIADEKGITGLREIGDKLGAKATSIRRLLSDILTAQQLVVRAPAPPQPEPAFEPAPEASEPQPEAEPEANEEQ